MPWLCVLQWFTRLLDFWLLIKYMSLYYKSLTVHTATLGNSLTALKPLQLAHGSPIVERAGLD